MSILADLVVCSPEPQEYVADIPEYLVLVEYQLEESMAVSEAMVVHLPLLVVLGEALGVPLARYPAVQEEVSTDHRLVEAVPLHAGFRPEVLVESQFLTMRFGQTAQRSTHLYPLPPQPISMLHPINYEDFFWHSVYMSHPQYQLKSLNLVGQITSHFGRLDLRGFDIEYPNKLTRHRTVQGQVNRS